MSGEVTSTLATELEAIASADRSFMHTDAGNAERLVHHHGDDLRYVPGIGWLAWDGCRWARDKNGEVMRRAKHSVRTMYGQAEKVEDKEKRAALIKHATASESEPRLRAAVTLARVERSIVAQADHLDAFPFLLNVTNGTLDLRTGKLRGHRRTDLLTKLAPVHYHEDATSSLWNKFVSELTGGDQELAEFLQRAVGYSLTGDTSEEVLFFTHGPAATGKTTFLEALKGTLGHGYATTTDFETFLKRRGDSGVRSDIARLAGARLVLGVEVDDGKQLAEGLLKQLTGGDTVTARFMYSDYFEYRPAFKLWLAANHRPRVSAADEAVWRRILQLPFTEVVPPERRDPQLKRALTDDPGARSAILAWAQKGCLAWQRIGLAVPPRVRDYTADYRAENDPLAGWLEQSCIFDAKAETTTAALHEDYNQWATENGEQPANTKAFAANLKARNCVQDRGGKGVRVWRGIALREGRVTSGDVTDGKSAS